MTDYVIDTNVLVVASVSASHVNPEEALIVQDWVAFFRADTDSFLVLDESFLIWKEYQKNLDEQDFGYIAMREKLASTQCRFRPISLDPDGNGILPTNLMEEVHDRSDRKFIAVVFADALGSSIVNATNSDWASWIDVLANHGVSVLQLLE